MWVVVFSNQNHGLKKKLFIEEVRLFVCTLCEKTTELNVVHPWRACNLSRWNKRGSDFYKNGKSKLKHFEEIVS